MNDKIVHCVTHKQLCEYRTESEESGCRKFDCDNLYRCEYKTLIIDKESLDDKG